MQQQAFGLDFGTSTSLVSTHDGIIRIGPETMWLSSVAVFDDRIVVTEDLDGWPADQVIRSVKRCITDGRDTVRVVTPAGVRNVPADDVIVEILREVMRQSVDRGVAPTSETTVRLGCPAMWNRSQRVRLIALAARAGLSVDFATLIDEPVAAGIAWLEQVAEPGTAGRIVVFDMGGGTLDIAVLEVTGMQNQGVSVLAALGAPEAGDKLDETIAEDLERQLAAEGIDVSALPDPAAARDYLLGTAREAKIMLSKEIDFPILLNRRILGSEAPATLWYKRKQLEEVFAPQLDRAENYVAAALRTARLTETGSGSAYDLMKTPMGKLAESVDHVLLSGGMSHVPLVAQRMTELFPNAKVSMASPQPEHAVALGLASTSRHSQINMFRPAFDIYVSWLEDGERQQRSVYEAFTPLYEPWQVAQGGSSLGYKRNGLELDLPRKAVGRLNVVSHSAARANVTLDGRNLDNFPVLLSEQKFEFVILCDGRIRLTDATGTVEGKVDDWFPVAIELG